MIVKCKTIISFNSISVKSVFNKNQINSLLRRSDEFKKEGLFIAKNFGRFENGIIRRGRRSKLILIIPFRCEAFK